MSALDASRIDPSSNRPAAAPSIEWWRGAVIYQIYPRSFLDSNGDGIGDLQGIINGLDYVASLGVDGIWLSPFFTSPMRDFGYDVANYIDVDPVFGSLSDFDAIIKKAHDLGLKVIIDQVYSHTSDMHDWFEKSRQDKSNPHADWYVWADPKADGTPPNNWLSVFGGSAWEWDSRRQQYYFHNFLPSQPDLNLHNKDVADALLGVARFWLERGVDGFRLDAINFAMHDPQLRNNPPAPVDGRSLSKPFDYQLHIYNQSHPNIPKFLERIRLLTNEYDGIFTVAEVGGPEPLNEMKAFTANGERLNSAYDFSFLYASQLTSELTKSVIRSWGRASNEGWPSWAFSNHDAPRAISRWADEKDASIAAKLYAMLLLSLRGNAFLYQGEELGLPQANIPFAYLQDPEAINNWPLTLGRDGARTPLPWKAKALNAGFSTGTTWLPVDPRHIKLAIDKQENRSDSTLNFIRSLIELRKTTPAIRHGNLSFVEEADDLLVFCRSANNDEALCVFNLGSHAVDWQPPKNKHFIRIADVGILDNGNEIPRSLPPLSGYIAIQQG